jgi:anti-sigma factor RsiW
MRSMDCAEVVDLLAAYSDDELTAEDRQAISTHLHHCPACTRALADLESLRSQIKAAGNHPMPAGFADRIASALQSAPAEAPLNPWRRYAAIAASHLLALAVGGMLAAAVLGRAETNTRLTNDVVAAHVRSMLSEQPVQVASSDTHTVRPWFAGRIAYSPQVKDLGPQGFPLIGGRVDYIADRTVAALVYGRRKHRITLFVFPVDQISAASSFQAARNGYNIVAWRDAAFAYIAASDLNAAELEELAAQLRGG